MGPRGPGGLRGKLRGQQGVSVLSARLALRPPQNYRKSSRHLAAFISKFVQFTHQYVACNAPAAIAFLQKHSDVLQ